MTRVGDVQVLSDAQMLGILGILVLVNMMVPVCDVQIMSDTQLFGILGILVLVNTMVCVMFRL